MVPDQLAQAVADPRASVIAVPVRGLRWYLSRIVRFGGGPEFFDGADADSVGFAQGTIDCSRFSNAKLGSAHDCRNICRRSVAQTSEASSKGRLDCRTDDPSIRGRITEILLDLGFDRQAPVLMGYSQQTRMSH